MTKTETLVSHLVDRAADLYDTHLDAGSRALFQLVDSLGKACSLLKDHPGGVATVYGHLLDAAAWGMLILYPDLVSSLDEVADKVVAERAHQEEKFGPQSVSNETWLHILLEEIGEASHVLNSIRLQEDVVDDYTHEMVQVIAVVVVWIEDQHTGREELG